MSYLINRNIHEKYGNVIEITRSEELGNFDTPFKAYLRAKLLRRLWMDEGVEKVRVLIDSQIMSITQAEGWAYEEYKLLPKCHRCACILHEDVYTHTLSFTSLFCSKTCADKDYVFEVERLNDSEESDF